LNPWFSARQVVPLGEALAHFFKNPGLLLLGLFPGIATVLVSTGLSYWIWIQWLAAFSPWLGVPALILLFLVLWLAIGNLALLPVEDAIVDKAQKLALGRIVEPALPLSMGRILRELRYSLLIGLFSFFLLLLSFVPFLTAVTLAAAAWLNAYQFLATAYSRRHERLQDRLLLFVSRPLTHLYLGARLNTLLFVPFLNVFLLGFALFFASWVHYRSEEKAGKTRIQNPLSL
jgi:uncharacterized protein involved in cysteine biosynthesis